MTCLLLLLLLQLLLLVSINNSVSLPQKPKFLDEAECENQTIFGMFWLERCKCIETEILIESIDSQAGIDCER